MVDARRRRERKETYDLGLGFVGFFVVAFVASTIYCEIVRVDAVWSAITALVAGGLLAVIWIARRRYLDRTAPDPHSEGNQRTHR